MKGGPRQERPSFSTWLTPDTWSDVSAVLRHTPPELRLARVRDCMAFADALRALEARPAMCAMRAAGARIYLPLLFQVLRTASLRPLVQAPRRAPPERPTRAEWAAQYRVPWEAGAVCAPQPSVGDHQQPDAAAAEVLKAEARHEACDAQDVGRAGAATQPRRRA